MSATGRGSKRREADFYATPAWVVRRLLEKLNLPGGKWLEPGAGEGDIIKAVGRGDVQWTAVDIREEVRPHLELLQPKPEIIITDKFLDWKEPALQGRLFDVAFGNPPYGLAMEFVQTAYDRAYHTVMLLRLNFLESAKRHEFLKYHMPDVYVLPNRPSFTGGGTDATAYAWFHWYPRFEDLGDPAPKIVMLDLTPDTERRPQS